MSLSGNPFLKDMTQEQLQDLLQRVKAAEKQAPTLHARLKSEEVKAGKGTSKSAVLKQKLADL